MGEKISWEDFSNRVGLDQPDHLLLSQYWHCLAPVVLLGNHWMEGQQRASLERGTQKNTLEHVPFLREDFYSMV